MGRPKKNEAGRGTTRGRILALARSAFEARGVAAVGVRELARDLGLSPGNVSYYFPTKDALVVALIEEAHAENNSTVLPAQDDALDFARVDGMIRTIMRRDLDNRWLMRDAVGLLVTLPALRPLQQRLHRAREGRVDSIVARLIAAGLLDRAAAEQALPLFRVQFVTLVFFWLPAAMLAAPERDPSERLDLHARAAMSLFRPLVTRAGRRALDAVLRASESGSR